jgi:hypothetical protein
MSIAEARDFVLTHIMNWLREGTRSAWKGLPLACPEDMQ